MGEFNVDKTTGGLEQTAGMPSEYPATQVMMSDGVTSVEEAIEANNLGVAIDISNATQSNPFTASSDGYVCMNTGSNDAFCVIAICGNNMQASIPKSVCFTNGHNMYDTIFIRKGMKVYKGQFTGTLAINFIPLA